ncbi:MAG: hypothetical protein E4H14_13435 [Candidatus Thorarchaeota archaeon]|nr:MAG: hypothetical protein E4H14_13435 [Candidatus Thorarchaeota archaeon]
MNESDEMFCEHVEICNFFAPKVTMNVPIEIGTDTNIWNLTWSSTDQNAGDVPYYSLWLSRDAGVTFVLLQQNLTFTNYIWDSTQWLLADYTVKVRAYSVDLTTDNCRVDNPPLSYWPGDYCNALSYLHAGGVGSGPPPSYSISANRLTYEFGSTNNTITVAFTYYSRPPPSTIEYFVTDNGSLWFQGVYVPESSLGSFTINIDGFSIGSHVLSITLPFGMDNPQSLTIIVIAPTTPNTIPTSSQQDWSPIIQTLAIGISIGSITVIALVLVLSLQLKRKQVIEYV